MSRGIGLAGKINSQSHCAVLWPVNSRNRLCLALILCPLVFALATVEFMVNIPKLWILDIF